MIKTIFFIILIFVLGFCCGCLFELKHTFEVLEMARKHNNEWGALCQKHNKEWSEYCKTLIDEIKTLKGVDTE